MNRSHKRYSAKVGVHTGAEMNCWTSELALSVSFRACLEHFGSNLRVLASTGMRKRRSLLGRNPRDESDGPLFKMSGDNRKHLNAFIEYGDLKMRTISFRCLGVSAVP